MKQHSIVQMRELATQGRLVVNRAARLEESTISKTSRVRTFLLTDNGVDRHNSTIDPAGWQTKNYESNPVVIKNHDWDSDPIGVGRTYVDDKGRRLVDVEFLTAEENPEAERTLKIVDRKIMGVSVGMRILKFEENKSRATGNKSEDFWNPPIDIKEQELVEVSVVTIPSNPRTLATERAAENQECVGGCPVCCVDKETSPPPVIENGQANDSVRGLSEKEPVTAEELKEMVSRITAEETRSAVRAAERERLGKTTMESK